ncbi:MAG: hypothetical protein MJY83_06090 [Bacteroidales bacterium]|nr:hypothetical protein [Bacteroidales bacterium]
MESFGDYFSAYWQVWLAEGIVMLAATALIILFWKRLSRAVMSHMLLFALLIWLAGTLLYSVGFAYEGSGHTMTSYLFRAMQAALGMFLSDNELVEVSPYYKESPVYMAIFALVHVSALFLSAIIILNTIGFRLKHFFLLLHESIDARRNDKDTYVFWGFSECSFHLARDVRERFPEARIIFIRATNETSIGERLELTELMNASANSVKLIKSTRAVNTIDDVIVAYMSAEKIENSKIGRLKTIFERSTNINFFFLSDDEGINLKLGAMIYADKSLSENPSKKVRIYTKVANGGSNRVLENHIVLERMRGNLADWKFVDQSFLSVTSLKRKFDLQPVMSLPSGTIRKGTVDARFTALILGFGDTGYEMFKYLYEFSSFVTSDGKHAERKIVLVDKDMDKLAGPLCITNPHIFHTDQVQMLGMNPGTVEFWRAVSEYASSINCIAIALGNDEVDANITMDIYRAILQYSKHRPENIKIFLRIYKPENEESIRNLASDYNSHKLETGIEIVPFGSISEIYNIDVIMGTDQLMAARKFNYNFDILRGRNVDCDESQAWAADYNVKKFIAKYKSAPLALDELTRRIMQCHADSLHIGTVLALAGISLDDKEAVGRFVEIVRSREADSMKYAAATPEQQALMNNLARSTQARLYASHWLLGYRFATPDVISANPMDAARQKLTDCMRPWEECTTEDKLLAYTVVDTSFIIAGEISELY